MALKLNLHESKTSIGIAVPNAYARISLLMFDTKSGYVQVTVETHSNQQARAANKNPVQSKVYRGKVGVDLPSLDADIPGVRAALYTWLKTLPDFDGAVDV